MNFYAAADIRAAEQRAARAARELDAAEKAGKVGRADAGGYRARAAAAEKLLAKARAAAAE